MNFDDYIVKYNKYIELQNLIEQLKKEVAGIDEQIKIIEQTPYQYPHMFEPTPEIPKKKSFFEKLFKRKKTNIENVNSWDDFDQNSPIKKSLKHKELADQKQELLAKIKNITEEINKLNIAPYLEIKNGQMIITDKEEITVEIIEDVTEKEIRDMKDEVAIIHCTDFFPKDKTIVTNYDGNKYFRYSVDYDGVNKECQTISHRHTTHFTLNRRVENTGDGAGSWDEPKYIIIDLLSKYINNFVRLDPADSFTYKSLKLEGKPIILVREDCINEIPKEELSNYQIILYQGNPTEAVKKVLNIQGIKYFDGNPNNVTHSASVYYSVEKNLARRDYIVNYIRDNTYDGKQKIELTIEEINEMYKILINNDSSAISIDSIAMRCDISNIGIPLEYAKFIIAFGIIPTSNGKFTFDSDENILQTIDNKKAIKVDMIKKIYNLMITNPSIKYNDSEISYDMTLKELYKIENHEICKKFINSLLSNETVSLFNGSSFNLNYIEETNDGLYLTFSVPENIYEQEDFGDAQFIKLFGLYEKSAIFTKKIADSNQVLGDVEESFNKYFKLLLTIKQKHINSSHEKSI